MTESFNGYQEDANLEQALPQPEEEKTYFLDGSIASKWTSGSITDLTIKPYHGSRELLSNTSIDAGNPGIISVVIATSELGDKTVGDTINLGGITRTDKGLITQAASELLKPKEDSVPEKKEDDPSIPAAA